MLIEKRNGISYTTYTFEDWLNGDLATDFFRYSGEYKLTNSKTGEFSIYFISEEDFEQIREAATALFEEKVSTRLNSLKSEFVKRFELSEDKSRLLDNEISLIEIKFGIKKSDERRHLVLKELSYPNYYKEHKINGRSIDYSKIINRKMKWNNRSDDGIVNFESTWRFWKWLISQVPSVLDSNESKQFSEFFKSISEYYQILTILVEAGTCEPNSFVWKDRSKGFKGLLIAFLKQLHFMGYYEIQPTSKHYQNIATTFFKCPVGIDTVNKTEPGNFDFTSTVLGKIPKRKNY